MTRLGTYPKEWFRCDRCGVEAAGEGHDGGVNGPPREKFGCGKYQPGWIWICNVPDGPHYCPECAPVVVRHMDEAIRAFVATIKLY